MKHDKQIGLRVGFPALFAVEVEEYHRHAKGPHKALTFPDFVGFLAGLGLEAYRKQNAPPRQVEPEASGADEDAWDFDGEEAPPRRAAGDW
jgi:hypothetical protein